MSGRSNWSDSTEPVSPGPGNPERAVLVETRLPLPLRPIGPLVNFVAGVKLSVYSKLLIGFLGGAFLLVLMGALSLIIISKMNDQVAELGLLQLKMDLAGQMEAAVPEQMHLRAMALLTDDDSFNERIIDARASFSGNLERVRLLESQHTATSFDSLNDANNRFIEAGDRTLELYESGKTRQALEVHLAEEHPLSSELKAATRSMFEAASLEWAGTIAEIDSDRGLLKTIVWSFSGLSVAVALFMGLVLSRSFIRPVRLIGDTLAKIAAGDFAQKVDIPNRDEFGSLSADVNAMSQRLAKLYDDLENANHSLEHRVRQRTDELEKAYEELVTAQRQVTASEKLAVIGQMSAGVAHDLRNPLGAIKNAIYIMGKTIRGHKTGAIDAKVLTYLAVIEEQIARSDGVINDLLDFARVGAAVLSPARINNVVNVALGNFVRRDNVNLTIDLDLDMGTVMADSEQLQRVFLNLANNAQEAMPQGGELTVMGRRHEGTVEVSFADTGLGIPAEIMDRIFDPLFTTKSTGTGLGLAVCREILNKHDGTISVTNDPGGKGGAIFTATLPAITA